MGKNKWSDSGAGEQNVRAGNNESALDASKGESTNVDGMERGGDNIYRRAVKMSPVLYQKHKHWELLPPPLLRGEGEAPTPHSSTPGHTAVVEEKEDRWLAG